MVRASCSPGSRRFLHVGPADLGRRRGAFDDPRPRKGGADAGRAALQEQCCSSYPPGPWHLNLGKSPPRRAILGRVRALGHAVRQGAIAVVAWLALVRAEAAHAANVRVAVELDEQRCVTLDEVRAAAALRGGRVDADSTVRLRVHVREAEPPSAVTLVISGEGAHGAIEARTIVADSCAEAASALGLVVTMAGEEEQAAVEASRAERLPLTPPARPSQGTARESSPASAASPARPSRATARETTPATKLYAALGLVATPLYVGPTGARLSGGLASDPCSRWVAVRVRFRDQERGERERRVVEDYR
ncbi:hypothetical protein [Sorangium sp. So ce233]|uniref:hypothetical protein n=1 Tax=Sorangium sp. So ce233 TaxID=3133290 RepID=UPI003F62E96B